MKPSILLAVMLLTGAAAPLPAQKADPLDVRLQEALRKENVEGDLKGAISLYEKILAGAAKNRRAASEALLHLGQCHEKLGSAEARRNYERLLRDFSDQQAASAARTRLAALGSGSGNSSTAKDRIIFQAFDAVNPRLSRNGRYIAYLCETQICLLDNASGVSRPVLPRPQKPGERYWRPLPSPDGQWVAYTYFLNEMQEGRAHLRIVRADGTGDRLLSEGQLATHEYLVPADWTADSQTLLVSLLSGDTPSLFTIPAAGGPRHPVSAPDLEWFAARDSVRLSADDRFIAYPSVPPGQRKGGYTTTGVHVIPLAGGVATPVMPGPDSKQVLGWLPSGDLLLKSNRSGNTRPYRVPMRDGKPNGEAQMLSSFQDWNLVASSLNDSSLLLWQREDLSDFYAHSPGAAPRKLELGFAGQNFVPSVSPDGQWLAYAAGQSEERTLIFHNLRTREERRHPHKFSGIRGLNWFSDSRSLLIDTFTGDFSTRTIFKVGLDTNDVKSYPELKEVGNSPVRIHPDGRRIILSRRHKTNPRDTIWFPKFYSLDLETMAATPLPTQDRNWTGWMQLSPDGRNMAYYEVDERTQIRRIILEALDGNGPRRTISECAATECELGTPFFTSDSSQLLFYRNPRQATKAALWIAPTTGGEAKPYLESDIFIGFPSYSALTKEVIGSRNRVRGTFRLVPLSSLTDKP